MLGLGTQELLIILMSIMIIFGARKLLQVDDALGKGLRIFRNGINDEEKTIALESSTSSADESQAER
jgi:sec-independent protein translocase protein TatA